MSTYLTVLLLVTSFLHAVIGQNYIIVVPQSWEDEKNIDIYVQMLNPVSYETIEGKLVDDNNKTVGTGSLSLTSGTQDGVLTIKPPKRDPEKHWWQLSVIVTGTGQVRFTNKTSIYFRHTHHGPDENQKIFIQTDKAWYKTGQKVLYRVFAIDSALKPVNDSYRISIIDPSSTRIVERNNVSDVLGMSGELQLSDHPNLGAWTIRVESESNKDLQENYRFTVNEYVLPKFEVLVTLPPIATTDKPELKGHVSAKYTHGKPVKGTVVLTIKRLADWWFFDPRAIQKRFNIDGEGDFNIPIDALQRFDPHLDYDTLVVEANVTETITGISDTGSQQVQFHKNTWNIEFFAGSPGYFKPGFKYTTYLKVSHPDGRPITASGERVKIGLTYYTDKPSQVRSYYMPPSVATSALMTFLSPFPEGKVVFQPDIYLPVPRNGMIKLTLDIPQEAATGRIDVEFKDQKLTKNLQQFRTLNGAFLNLDIKDSKLKVGERAEFSFTSNVLPTSRITYHIVRDTQILETHYTRIGSPFRPHTVYQTITHDMALRSRLVAYFVHRDGEIIADSIDFSVDISFENKVDLQFEQSQVEPGSNVSLKIKADPESRVSLLVVDKNVRLHGTGNDITREKVKSRFVWPGYYGTHDDWSYQGRALPRRAPVADDSSDIFQAAGLKVLTDAKIHEFNLNDVKLEIESRAGPFGIDVNEVMTDHHHTHGHGWSGSRFISRDVTRVRKDFPETWIWTNVVVGANGSMDMSAIVPDTITNWQATAFALNMDSGLGITEVPSNLTVYMPFYVTLQLPFSVVNGEIAVVQAVVFNYYPYDMYVTVTLMASKEDFVGTTVQYYGRQEVDDEGNMTRCILVKSNDASSAYFNIRPIRNGMIDLEVHATSPRGNDAVIRSVIVKPKGQPEEKNIPTLITMQPGKQYIKEIPIEYPMNVVADSQRLRISVTGDVFGPSMDNLEALVVTPWGSGEQNMVRFAPAIYAANYLKVTGKQDEELQEEIQDVLTTGYQRQMKYRHYDGSFSAFGSQDGSGSFWLTAFVLKSFAQASDHIYIDTEVMVKAATFIIDHQTPDGSFNSSGRVYMKSMQGSSASSRRSRTAFALIAFKEVQDREIDTDIAKNLTTSTQRASNYLNQEMSRMTDDYELAISSYALALMKSPSARSILTRLSSSSRIVSSTEMNEDWKYWRDNDKAKEIEINAYALLAYSELEDINSGLPILKWLVRQRTSYGGFVSTQDTVIALQALAKFASLATTNDVSMTLTIETPTKKLPPFVLNADNKDVVQFIDVPGLHENVKITAVGIGTGLVEVASFYNYFGVMENANEGTIQLVLTTNATDVNQFQLEACVRSKVPDSGVVLMEIGVPSGYKPNLDSFDLFKVKHKEMNGEKLSVYFHQVTEEALCIKVTALRERIVGKVQPASVRVFSHYNPRKSITHWYLPDILRNKTLCDVCGVECGCKFDPDKVPEERCKRGTLVPVMPRPSEYQGTSAFRSHTETRSMPRPAMPVGTTWTRRTQSNVVGRPSMPMGTSWSRRTRTRLGGPTIPVGTSWRKETRIKSQPTIPVGSSWQRTTRIRGQPSMPVGASWRKETRVRGMPNIPIGGSWHHRKTTRIAGRPAVEAANTWQSRRTSRVIGQPTQTGASTWQSHRNVWGNNPVPASNVVASRSRTVNIG